MEKQFGALNFQTSLGYELTRSTIRGKGNQADPDLVGKQLIHTPIHQFKSTFGWRYKNTRLSYNHMVTGKRYTATDNSQSLGAFQIGDILINQTFKAKKHSFHFQFQINNLFNSNYVILPARPMPMRNYRMNLSFQF
jgi:iron complex outermembrane receptor protein